MLALVLQLSIALRVVALAASLWLAHRLRDLRITFLSAMLAFMAWRQLLTLGRSDLRGDGGTSELPGLIVSALALLAVFGLAQLLRERQRAADELRESEARLRALVGSALDVVIMLDRKGRIEYASPSLKEQLGRDPAALVGHDALELVAEEDREKVAAEFAAALAEPGVRHGVECRCVHADGSLRTFETRGVVVVGAAGKPQALLSLRDVTAERQREQLEAQLYQAQKLETLGTLAGGIAHDFNNILTPILGSAELMRARLAGDAESLRDLDRIVEAGNRARGLVQRMLTIGRKLETRTEPVDLRGVVAETMELLRASLPSTLAIHVEIPDEPVTVMTDALQMHQVLMNLCTNAAHAMRDAASGSLTISLTRTDDPSAAAAGPERRLPALASVGHARLRVRDSGVGMDAAVLARVFEPFFTTRRVGEGSGLGLAVVHGIVKGAGGFVDVRSESGRGTTFDVYLPLTDAHPSPPAERPRRRASQLRGRIMLVDDEASVLAVCSELLQLDGYEVLPFGDPRAALQHFEQASSDVDVVVTDHTMPNMTGLELARALCRLRGDLPIVLTTGFAARDQDRGDGEQPYTVLLPKPYTTDELSSAIERARELRRPLPAAKTG